MIFLLVSFVNGVGLGINVLTARYYGARDEQALRREVHITIALGMAARLALTGGALPGSALTPVCCRGL